MVVFAALKALEVVVTGPVGDEGEHLVGFVVLDLDDGAGQGFVLRIDDGAGEFTRLFLGVRDSSNG